MKIAGFATLFFLMTLTANVFAQSDAQKSFARLKTLEGSWEGTITTVPKAKEVEGKTMNVTFRVTSMGNVLMHEMTGAGRPDDPITMFYVDAEGLALTHYCDAGNRPKMTGKASADGNSVDYELVHVDGGMEYGHMHGATITLIDADHHSEDWTFMMPGDKAVRAHIELRRKK